MLTRRQFGSGLGITTLAALAMITGCDDAGSGSGERTPEVEKDSEAARNASIEAMKKRGTAKKR